MWGGPQIPYPLRVVLQELKQIVVAITLSPTAFAYDAFIPCW
jgi:hypothetical protein